MSTSKTKKGIYNVLFGFLSEAIVIILGLIIPRLFLLSYGSEMNGLLNSVSQLYVYMTLLEAGVGTAAMQALFKPVAQDDYKAINGILSATHRYYKRIGAVYLLFVILLSFIYPLVTPTNVPYWTVAVIIFLNGIISAISFFFHAKYRLLLQAEGKKYIITNLNLIIHILTSVAKVSLILLGYNIIVIQATFTAINSIQLIYISFYIKRRYRWIDLTVEPDKNALSQKNSAFFHQISELVFRNTDVLILTYAPNCGLLMVSVYTMYNMLLNMISSAVNTVCSGIDFILGQTFNTDRKRYEKLHDIYETYSIALVFSLHTVAYFLIDSFLSVYTNRIDDINYVDPWLPLLFTIVFLLSSSRRASAQVIYYAQHYKKTQNRAIIEACINIFVSIIGVYFVGIYGVLIGTIAALLYRSNDMIIYANRVILQRSCFATYRRWIASIMLFGIFAFVFDLVDLDLNSYLQIIVVAIIACLIVIPSYFTLLSILERKVFKNAKDIILAKLRARKNSKN